MSQLPTSEQRRLIRAHMLQRMSHGSQQYYGSQLKIAEETGLSLSTVKRRMKEMQTSRVPLDEQIVKTEKTFCRWGKRMPVYRLAVRQCELQEAKTKSNTPRPTSRTSSLRFDHRALKGPGSRRAQKPRPPRTGRRRRLMNHPDRLPAGGIVRKSGAMTPFNAADAVAATVDLCRERQIMLPTTFRARLGKAAKACLEGGASPEMTVAALFVAVRRARPDLVENILVEMQAAAQGEWLGYREFQQILRSSSELVKAQRSAHPLDEMTRKRIK